VAKKKEGKERGRRKIEVDNRSSFIIIIMGFYGSQWRSSLLGSDLFYDRMYYKINLSIHSTVERMFEEGRKGLELHLAVDRYPCLDCKRRGMVSKAFQGSSNVNPISKGSLGYLI
jgi:hypothetical protein